MRRSDKERGQTIIEAAIILPVIVALGFLGLQSLWTLQCGDSLTAAIEHVRHSVRAGDACTGEAAEIRIKDMLIETQPLLATGELTVTNAEIVQDAPTTESVQLPDDDFDDFSIASKNVISTRMRIKATVTYRPPSLVWNARPTYGRNIDTAVLVDERFEIG